MKLTVFGASGNLGTRIVAETVKRGHRVTAFARRLDVLSSQKGLALVAGDVLDTNRVAEAVRDKDAIISAFGPSGFYQGVIDEVLPVGMMNLVAAMRTAGVQRIVAVGESGLLQADPRTLRMESPKYPSFLRPLVAEHRKAYEILRSSDLDWTLVCPPRMTPGERDGRYVVEADYFPKGASGAVSLENVAEFLAEEVEAGRFLGRRVGIAGTERPGTT